LPEMRDGADRGLSVRGGPVQWIRWKRAASRRYGEAVLMAGGFLFFIVAWALPVQADVVDRIVAVVNNEIITLSQLDEATVPYAERLKHSNYSASVQRDMLAKIRKDLLEGMIEQKIADQEIRKAGITVSEKEIDAAIERIKSERDVTDEQLMNALSREGVTFEEYRKNLMEHMLRSRLVQREVSSKIVVTTADVRKFYEENAEKFQGSKRYRLRSIVMYFARSAGAEEKEGVRRRMEEVHASLLRGASFPAVAGSHSESPLAADGGDLGFFHLDELTVELQQVVSGMKEGQISDVLETDNGFQILWLEEVEEQTGKTLVEATAEIERELYEKAVDEKYRQWLADLKKRSYIKVIQ